MPELPEVETTVKSLNILKNKKVIKVDIHVKKLRYLVPHFGLKNIINAAYDKIKKREGRNPYLLELQRETGIFDNVIKKNLDRPLTSGRTVGPLRGAGAKATKEMYKTKKEH